MDEVFIENLNSKSDQKEIFLNLYEIFGDVVSDNIISRVCCDSKWNFDKCVQTLIKYAEDNPKDFYDNNQPKTYNIENFTKRQHKNLVLQDTYVDTFSVKKQGAIPKNPNILCDDATKEYTSKSQHNLQYLPNLKTIFGHINSGHKIMIIMRGAPGSGKTFLAKKIVELTVKGDYTQYIHSTDNYFYNSSDKYCYEPQSLSDAHEYNQKIVKRKALEGWSPIIVDNTNTKIWEMLPYVKIAVQNGYLVDILQPNTPWNNSVTKLFKKNIHGVPKKKIENHLNNFEPIHKDQITKLLKTTHYLVPLPQMRRQPNIPFNLSFNSNKTNHNSMLLENISLDTSNKIKNEKSSQSRFSLQDISRLSLRGSHNTKNNKCSETLSLSNTNEKFFTKEKYKYENNNHPSNLELSRHKDNNQKFEIHAINCPNENKSFYTIRQIYPNKSYSELWNLFVKYNGITDCLIDALLNDDYGPDQNSRNEKANIIFTCNCDLQNNEVNENTLINKSHKKLDETNEILPTCMINEELSKRSKNYENQSTIEPPELQSVQLGLEEFDKKQDIADVDNDLCEIKLGEEFVKQLENIFGIDSKLKETVTNYHTNVFMPKTLAKDLYALWMESLFNQIEEQKQITIKEDEEFAKFLETYLIESNNIGADIADNIELAWFKCNSDEQYSGSTRKNLEFYSHLIKLFQMFPQIPKETIIDVFQAHDNQLDETITVLHNSINNSDDNKLNLLNSKNDKIYSEQAKRAALRDFETSRNHAAHHSQLKAECFEKAKEAIKRNSPSVAVYYSHIANFHNTKIDMCNQKAANCILEVNDWKQSNPDFIDLHYLHTMEAIECLDIFLDKHLIKLKNIRRTYKYVFIITGRGLHSAGGISTIKNKVKTRLKERNLKWSEVNPGLLKVKLFTSSKFSQNC